jgi:mono/diheme cytochrome c family protein
LGFRATRFNPSCTQRSRDCGECHTRRDGFGGLDLQQWLAGADNPDGEGQIPNITPDQAGIDEWSERDLGFYCESGMDPDYDSVGGSMVKVQENLARLGPEDRAPIVAYLKAIAALPEAEIRPQEMPMTAFEQ